jgi:HSP20 family protein
MMPAIRNNSAIVPVGGAPINRLSSVFDRLFEDYLTPPGAATWARLPLSMWEDENHLYIEMDAPGLTDKDVDVSVENGQLAIRGERKSERKEGGYDTRSYGRFEQIVSLPANVETDNVEARLINGVLSLTFPKSEASKPRKIALKAE